jgi:hypothetical protein
VNGLVTPNNNKVLNSDIILLYDNDKTVETNLKKKKSKLCMRKTPMQQQLFKEQRKPHYINYLRQPRKGICK